MTTNHALRIPPHLLTTKQGFEIVPGDVLVDDDLGIAAVFNEKRHPFSIELSIVRVTAEGDDDTHEHVHRTQHVTVMRDTKAVYTGGEWRIAMTVGKVMIQNAHAPDLADALRDALVHFDPTLRIANDNDAERVRYLGDDL